MHVLGDTGGGKWCGTSGEDGVGVLHGEVKGSRAIRHGRDEPRNFKAPTPLSLIVSHLHPSPLISHVPRHWRDHLLAKGTCRCPISTGMNLTGMAGDQ